MLALVKRLPRKVATEAGFTVVELTVTMAVMGTVMAVFLSVLASVQGAVVKEQDRSRTNDQARLAVEQMDREIRSGNVLYDPAGESPANYMLRVYTQANGNTRTPPNQCVQWRIEGQQLKRRSYQVTGGTPSVIADWRVVAEGIVNRDLSPPVPAFALDPSGGGRIVNITLMSNARLGSPTSPAVRIHTSVAIRNSWTGDPCTPAPAG